MTPLEMKKLRRIIHFIINGRRLGGKVISRVFGERNVLNEIIDGTDEEKRELIVLFDVFRSRSIEDIVTEVLADEDE